jgi:hypothetical protein
MRHPQWAARQPSGGNLAPRCRKIRSVPAAHPPDALQTVTAAPTAGRAAAIKGGGGGNLAPKCWTILSAPAAHPTVAPQTAAAATTGARTAAIGGKPGAKVSEHFYRPPPLIHPMRPKRPPLHPVGRMAVIWGKTSAEESEHLIGSRRSSTRCATNDRHCTHNGLHGGHLGGIFAPKCQNLLSAPAAHPPDAPQTAAVGPHGSHMGETWRCRKI